MGNAAALPAVLTGAIIGAGCFLLIMALRGFTPKPGKPNGRDRDELIRSLSTRAGIAALVGVAVLVVTSLPVAAIGCGLLAFVWNTIAGGAGEERRAMARLEALAAWTESLRDTIAGAVGLEQAIPSSLRAVGPALEPQVRQLVDRMHTRMPLPDALRAFGDELDDPSADLVVAALVLNARLRGPGLREMLGALSTSARAELDMRRRVEANRRTTRRSVQIVVGVSVGTALMLAIFNPTYLQPYKSFTGELVLAIVVALFGLGFVWLRRLAKYDMPQRFLATREPAATPVSATPRRGSVPVAQRPTGERGGVSL